MLPLDMGLSEGHSQGTLSQGYRGRLPRQVLGGAFPSESPAGLSPCPPSTGSPDLRPAFLIPRASLFLDAWDLENMSMEIKTLAWIS